MEITPLAIGTLTRIEMIMSYLSIILWICIIFYLFKKWKELDIVTRVFTISATVLLMSNITYYYSGNTDVQIYAFRIWLVPLLFVFIETTIMVYPSIKICVKKANKYLFKGTPS